MKRMFLSFLIIQILFSLTSTSYAMESTSIEAPHGYQVKRTIKPNGLSWRIDAPNNSKSLKIYTGPLYKKDLLIQNIKFLDTHNCIYCYFNAFNAFFFGITTHIEKPEKVSMWLGSVNNMPSTLGRFLSARFGFKVALVFFSFKEEIVDPCLFLSSPQIIPDCTVLMSAKTKDISRNLTS